MMIRVMESELKKDRKLKIKISCSKNLTEHYKTFSAKNISHSNLTWKDIAGLSLNIAEEDA